MTLKIIKTSKIIYKNDKNIKKIIKILIFLRWKKMKKQDMDMIFSKLDYKPVPKKQKTQDNFDFSQLSTKLTKKYPVSNTVLYKPIENLLDEEKFNDKGSHLIKKILKNDELFTQKLESGNFLLEKYQKKLKLKPPHTEISEKAFGKKLEKQLKYFKIPDSCASYSLYLPMNLLWRQYMSSLLENEKTDDSFILKFLKADLHGAIVKILCSKCKSYEGKSGIIIKETMKSFKIVTIDNKILTILKQNSIFLIEVLNKCVKIYGQHLCYRPSDRVKIKFKMKEASKFILDNVEEEDC